MQAKHLSGCQLMLRSSSSCLCRCHSCIQPAGQAVRLLLQRILHLRQLLQLLTQVLGL
jgi:hypothetical protein